MLRSVLVLGFVTAGLLFDAAAIAHSPVEPHGDNPQHMQAVSKAPAGTMQAASSTPLLHQWCGTPAGPADNTANAVHPRSAHVIKVVYAHAADQPNRFAEQANIIQSEVRSAVELFMSETGNQRSLRLDLGTDCSPFVLDVAQVRLPAPLSTYQDNNRRYTELWNALTDWRASAGIPSHWNLAVYADQAASPNAPTAGQAAWPNDPNKTGNQAAAGGLMAFAYGVQGASDAYSYWGKATILHEILHNLGSVQTNAPHATPYGHCTDGTDIMCYADGPGVTMQQSCQPAANGYGAALDCNRDTYFNPAPAVGSYLDTNWNVHDSPFLCAAATCFPQGPIPPDPGKPDDKPNPDDVDPDARPGRVSKPRLVRYTKNRAYAIVRWRKRPSAEHVLRYEVRAVTFSRSGRRVVSTSKVSADALQTTVQLRRGRVTEVRVRARNARGAGRLSGALRVRGRR